MLNRRQFGLITGAASLAAPALLRAEALKRAIVIGAGAAGLTAAFHLKRAGIDIRVLEAAPQWGGRVKRLSDFADLPLDLGAEWIHTDPQVLGEIVGQTGSQMGIETIPYRPETYKLWDNGALRDFDLLRFTYEEAKFKSTTWYGYFEQVMMPTLAVDLRMNAVVTYIETSTEGLRVHTDDGQTYDADKVLATVPVSILQSGEIKLSSDLWRTRLEQVQDITFGNGLKVFMRFQERFYPDIVLEGSRWGVLMESVPEKIFYDAAFGKPTDQNILALFNVSDQPIPLTQMDDDAILEGVLDELTQMFGSVVRETFVSGHVQNWNRERFVRGSYTLGDDSLLGASEVMSPIEGKLFFAGEAFGGATVHGAAFSGASTAEKMMG